MLIKTKIALAAVLILGTASAALAESDRDEGGGYAIQGMAGANHHPDIFGTAGNAYRAYGYAAPQSSQGGWEERK